MLVSPTAITEDDYISEEMSHIVAVLLEELRLAGKDLDRKIKMIFDDPCEKPSTLREMIRLRRMATVVIAALRSNDNRVRIRAEHCLRQRDGSLLRFLLEVI